MELIYKEELVKYINSISTHLLNEWDTLGVLDAIEKQKSVDAEPVRHGHWIPKSLRYRDLFARDYRCSECGADPIGTSNYCPNCGAKMDGKDVENGN